MLGPMAKPIAGRRLRPMLGPMVGTMVRKGESERRESGRGWERERGEGRGAER